MSERQKSLSLLLVLTAAVGLYACPASAQRPAPGAEPIATTTNLAGNAQEPVVAPAAMDSLRSVALRLDDAARQADFSSRAQGLLQLESARDRLENSINELCCARRDRAARLESNIDRVIARARVDLGPLLSTTGAASGPPAPNRDELLILAKEGENLLRNSAALPVDQRYEELLSARNESTWRPLPLASSARSTAPSDTWSQFPLGQLEPKMYGFRF